MQNKLLYTDLYVCMYKNVAKIKVVAFNACNCCLKLC